MIANMDDVADTRDQTDCQYELGQIYNIVYDCALYGFYI